MNRPPSLNAVLVALCLLPGLTAQSPLQLQPCEQADTHLRDGLDMATVVEAETIDDWRLDRMVEGCRITAAGLTRRSLRAEARAFYDGLRSAGWLRTPDPQDAPNEASLRFRMSGADCLFNVYDGGLLGTDAELAVDDQRVPTGGQRRFNVLVLCTPAEDTPLPRR